MMLTSLFRKSPIHITLLPCATLLMSALLVGPLCTLAADNELHNERQLPVKLRADRIDVDQKKAFSLYRGHVVFNQGTLNLTAASAKVQNRASNIETVTAEGKPVSFRHRPEGQTEFIEGEALRVVYHAPTQHVDLYGDVQVQRGRDLFRSAVLHYDIENQDMIAEGTNEQRVYVALVPHASKPETVDDKP
jgi:lipopolysaccharide transport protein LptA